MSFFGPIDIDTASQTRLTWMRFKRHRLAMVGLVLVVLLYLTAGLAEPPAERRSQVTRAGEPADGARPARAPVRRGARGAARAAARGRRVEECARSDTCLHLSKFLAALSQCRRRAIGHGRRRRKRLLDRRL